jgi:hemolysin activation/secretion protein
MVTEGRLVDVRVLGNRHFSSNNVIRALPAIGNLSARKDQVLNSSIFQQELDSANQNRDRQIYPTITPGPEPGTSALSLKVKDRIPLHGRVEVNNQSTPGTPEWRINASANYNNLWQREHQIGLSYGFTPEEFKAGGKEPDYILNRPLVANYGAYYRIPIGGAESISDRIQNSTGFGYDEATHQFRVPPAGGRPDLTIYASVSSSDTGIKYGPEKLVGTNNTPDYTLTSQETGQNLSLNQGVGTRFNFPLVVGDRAHWNFSIGVDYKGYELKSYNTNNFYTYEVVEDDITGEVTLDRTVISAGQPPRRNQVGYLPLTVGVDLFKGDQHGSTTASFSTSYNPVGDSGDFSQAAYSRKASASFAKLNLSINREQKIYKDWLLVLKANAQAASGPLIGNEQIALGGLNSIRGYFEGDEYGDAGYAGTIEVRTPYLAPHVPIWSGLVPAWLRGIAFIDGGQRFLIDESATQQPERSLLGVGFGLSANVNNRFDMRLTLGWPLMDSLNTPTREPRAYFSFGGQF